MEVTLGKDSDGEPRRWRGLAEFSRDRDRGWQLRRTGQSRQRTSVMCAALCPDRNEGWGENRSVSQAVGVVRTMCAGRPAAQGEDRMLSAELSVLLTHNVRPLAKGEGERLKRCLAQSRSTSLRPGVLL